MIALSLLVGLAIPASATAPTAESTCDSFATQQEAQYYYLLGTAPADLDGDGDGIACKELPTGLRRGGTKIFTNTGTNGIRFEVYAVDNQEWYLKVYGWREPFTTRSFTSSQAALDYGRCYFNNRCSN